MSQRDGAMNLSPRTVETLCEIAAEGDDRDKAMAGALLEAVVADVNDGGST